MIPHRAPAQDRLRRRQRSRAGVLGFVAADGKRITEPGALAVGLGVCRTRPVIAHRRNPLFLQFHAGLFSRVLRAPQRSQVGAPQDLSALFSTQKEPASAPKRGKQRQALYAESTGGLCMKVPMSL